MRDVDDVRVPEKFLIKKKRKLFYRVISMGLIPGEVLTECKR